MSALKAKLLLIFIRKRKFTFSCRKYYFPERKTRSRRSYVTLLWLRGREYCGFCD